MSNPYDSSYDEVEERFIQFLGDAKVRLDGIVSPRHQAPSQIPTGAVELRARLEGQLEAAKEERLERKLAELRADLVAYFPGGVTLPLPNAKLGPVADEAPKVTRTADVKYDDIFEYVRAAYEAYGDLLGQL